MTERSAKLIFWIGTLSSLALFLALTVDTHRNFDALTHADKLDEHVVAGKRAFERHNCNDCHTILGFGGYYSPDLTRVYTRVGEETIRNRIERPELVLASSYRKMPQQHVPPAEIDAIVAFLRWTSEIENGDWPPHDSEIRWKSSTRRLLAGATLSPGAALVKQENCLACHALGDAGERVGPRLEYIGMRRDPTYIVEYLADPQRFTPGTSMPSYGEHAPPPAPVDRRVHREPRLQPPGDAVTYQTQRVAYPYFVVALLLFGLQLVARAVARLQLLVHGPAGDRRRVPVLDRARDAHEPARALALARVHGRDLLRHPGGDEVRARVAEGRHRPARHPHGHRRGRAGRLPLRLDAGQAAARDPDAARFPGRRRRAHVPRQRRRHDLQGAATSPRRRARCSPAWCSSR